MHPAQLRDRAEFEAWVAAIPDHLARLRTLPGVDSANLDFTPASLVWVDRFVLGRFPSAPELLAAASVPDFHALAAYLGEVSVRNQGGTWVIWPEYKDGVEQMYKGFPLVRVGNSHVLQSPHASIMTRVKRRDHLDLKTAYDKFTEYLVKRAARREGT